MWIKPVLLTVWTIIAGLHTSQPIIIPFSLIELFLIFYLSNLVGQSHKKAGYVINSILCLFFIIQISILFFSGEFISALMFENLNMLDNLGNMLYVYIIGVIGGIIIAFLPFSIHEKYCSKKIFWFSLLFYACISVTTFLIKKDTYSPLSSLLQTTTETIINKSINYSHKKADKEKILKSFHKNSIEGSDAAIRLNCPKSPNIIVLFVEGLSAEVIDVFNNLNLNLTPNLNQFYSRSLVFKNYYNHTAPTFRGIRGQLFSCFQYLGGYYGDGTGFGQIDNETLNKRTNTKLISLIDILKENGYETSFINVEVGNIKTTNYFKTFKFDKIISGNHNLSDKEAFELLEETVLESKAPFFIGIYTLDTHHGFDSQDLKYGKGNNPMLNKFYNFDAHFGTFFQHLLEKNVFENTILVFTTDHASYNAPEYKSTFKSNQESLIGKVPLFIYWDGIEHDIIDAEGRNSLDLTPTILDLLRIYDHENYFLGTSLFVQDKNKFDKTSALGNDFFYTGDGTVEPIKKRNRTTSQIKKYYAISVNED